MMGDRLLLGLGRYMIPIPRIVWRSAVNSDARKARAELGFHRFLGISDLQ